MIICSSIDEYILWRKNISGTIGFIPTMGALHEGHLSLIKTSINLCKHTAVSIFLNPTQFSPSEDLETYPNNIDKDINLLSNYDIDCIFIPQIKELYLKDFKTFINVEGLSNLLEGKSRPHFFRGVTTILVKLFNIIDPNFVFFGQKDAQQLRIVKQLVKDLNYRINIISCPIIRENSGLAMSSRNQYLSLVDKNKASIIFKSLKIAEQSLLSGEKKVNIIKNIIKKKLLEEKLLTIDYISIADKETLDEIVNTIESDILISIAVYIKDIRLIDNIIYSY